MPRKYFPAEKLFEVDGLVCWHTYDPGCGGESDRRNCYHYTLDEEQAEVDMGTSNWFDVRELPMYRKYRGEYWPTTEYWEPGKHALIILAQIAADPGAIPLGEDYMVNY